MANKKFNKSKSKSKEYEFHYFVDKITKEQAQLIEDAIFTTIIAMGKLGGGGYKVFLLKEEDNE